MKKIFLMLSIMSTSLLAESYVMPIDKKHYEKNIVVETYVDKNQPALTCELPEVLNKEGTACEIPTPTCELPLILNQAGDACINNIESVNWIDTTSDTCNGMRQANFDSNVFFARSKTATYSISLEIPQGYRWLTKLEYTNLFNASTVGNKSSSIAVYRFQCGESNYPRSVNGHDQHVILFNDNSQTGMHAGNYEYHGATLQGYAGSNNFLGYVLYKEF